MLGHRTLAHADWSRKRRRAADVGDRAELQGRRAKAAHEERMSGGACRGDVWAPSLTAPLGHG